MFNYVAKDMAIASHKFLRKLFSLVKSFLKLFQKHACKRKRPWDFVPNPTSFLKKAGQKLRGKLRFPKCKRNKIQQKE